MSTTTLDRRERFRAAGEFGGEHRVLHVHARLGSGRAVFGWATPEIRKVICSTDAIESVNARIRKAVRARGHFPNEAAAFMGGAGVRRLQPGPDGAVKDRG